MHQISSYMFRHSVGASVGYVFQCRESWFYVFIFTLCMVHTMYMSLAAIFHQLSVTRSSTANSEYYSNGMLSIVALSSITLLVCSPYKVKAVPLQAWSGPEGSRKLRFPDYMTTAQEGGKVVSLTHRPQLPPGNSPGTHFC